MKILYVANERRAAQLAAGALRDLAQDVRIAWAGSQSAALSWVQGNPDVASVIVESEVQSQHCGPFVARVRDMGLTAPVIVVASEHEGAAHAAHSAGARHCVVKNWS